MSLVFEDFTCKSKKLHTVCLSMPGLFLLLHRSSYSNMLSQMAEFPSLFQSSVLLYMETVFSLSVDVDSV